MKNNVILNELKRIKLKTKNATDRKMVEETIEKTKNHLDKLYNLAFFDTNVNIGNFNKLKEDYEMLKKEKGGNVYMLSLRIHKFKDNAIVEPKEKNEKDKLVMEYIEKIKQLNYLVNGKNEKLLLYRVDNTINILISGHKKGTKLREKIDMNRDLLPEITNVGYNKVVNKNAKTSKNIIDTIFNNVFKYRKGGKNEKI